MGDKEENIVEVTPERLSEGLAWTKRPENLARLEAITDDDIAAQIADNPDAAPELDDAWFARARLVRPLKAAE